MTNSRITENLATTGFIPPSNQAVGSQNTTGHLLDHFRRRIYTLVVGAVTAGGNAVLKLQASPDGATNWVDVPGAATAPLTAPGFAQIEIQADRFRALKLGEYARAVVTVAAQPVFTAVLVQAGNSRYQPASDYNLTGSPAAVLI